MWLKITNNYSPNFSLPKRSKKKIKFIILHYTGMKKETLAIKRLCDLKAKVSSHYFIKKNGKILNLVPDLYEAWHAGKSSWKTYKSLNKYSIGIEISNPGHQNGYKKFGLKQILSLKKLLTILKKRYKIKNQNVLGHSDIAPDRKMDPGEKFPWKELSRLNLCKWHNLKEQNIQRSRLKKTTLKEKKIFLKNLKIIGYSITTNNYFYVVKAFQRRFRQTEINGKIDEECFLISKNLLK